MNRPHPWVRGLQQFARLQPYLFCAHRQGLLTSFIELVKNPKYKFWCMRPCLRKCPALSLTSIAAHKFTTATTEIEKLFASVKSGLLQGGA